MISISNGLRLSVFIVFIVGDGAVRWWMYTTWPKVTDRCSEDYPELSVKLRHPEWMSNGGIREESDGAIYPQGAWWQKDGEVWGCPCSQGKPCLRKCCGLDEIWKFNRKMKTFLCVKKNTFTNFIDDLSIYKEKNAPFEYVPIKPTPDEYHILSKGCKGMHYKEATNNSIILLSDGSARDTVKKFTWDQSDFCIESTEDSVERSVFHICSSALEKFIRYENIVRNMTLTVKVLAGLLVMFSLLVYTVVPRLRRGYGKAIMCYLITELSRKIIYRLNQFPSKYSPCIIDSGPLRVLMDLSLGSWTVMISYQMYILVGPMTLTALDAQFNFLLQCSLAWGIPFAVALLSGVADQFPSLPGFLYPDFGGKTCYFQNPGAEWLYVTTPNVVATICTMVFCLATLSRLSASRRNARSFKTPNSSRHNGPEVQWSCLYVKVCLIIKCLNYLISVGLSVLSQIVFVTPAVILTSQDIQSTRGVEVFLIFICQREIMVEFFKKMKSFLKM